MGVSLNPSLSAKLRAAFETFHWNFDPVSVAPIVIVKRDPAGPSPLVVQHDRLLVKNRGRIRCALWAVHEIGLAPFEAVSAVIELVKNRGRSRRGLWVVVEVGTAPFEAVSVAIEVVKNRGRIRCALWVVVAVGTAPFDAVSTAVALEEEEVVVVDFSLLRCCGGPVLRH